MATSKLPKALRNLPFLVWLLICLVALGLFPLTIMVLIGWGISRFMAPDYDGRQGY
jgi:hypothetical protein